MVKPAIACALLATACFEDRYTCSSDADCDLGPNARCELDGFCTVFDPSCETERRYSDHSAELANACFAGQVALVNPCAGGQPAAIADGCAATVCEVVPACCEVGWSDACVQQAQLRCPDRCDTRIAVTATRGATIEHWELAWNGATWTGTQRTDRAGLIAWIGPAPGTRDPRLAGFDLDQTSLLVGDLAIPATPVDRRQYQAITSVDFDRSGRDTLAVTYTEGAQHVQLIDVARAEVRDIFTDVGLRLVWGDSDRDAFPDGIAGRGAAYTLLHNIDNAIHVRSIEATQTSNIGGGGTTGVQALRSLDWGDLTRDGRLDLVVFGSQIRVHADEGALRDTPLIALDCDPLVIAGTMTCNDMMTESQLTSWAGTTVPRADGSTALAVALFTDPARTLDRALFEVVVEPGPPAAFTTTRILDGCPTCPEIIAVFARDLDGDQILDLVGLDSDLRIYTLVSAGGNSALELDPGFLGTANGPFTNVTTSVSGAVIP